jgi:Fic family protein
MHEYERSHPWITFQPNLVNLPYTVWMLVGEVQAKCNYITNAPFPPQVAKRLKRVYLAKSVHATTAIEGNTLTEEQVQEFLEERLRLPPSQKYHEMQIANILAGYNLVGNRILTGDVRAFTPTLLKEYHAAITRDLPNENDNVPGEFRLHNVMVGHYRGVPAEDCQYLVERLCEMLNTEWVKSDSEFRVGFEILRAVIAHLYIAWIHPFADGNGRTARLVEFKILLQAGLPDIAAHLLSNHYNLTRDEYYRQLQYASESGGDITAFIKYALVGLRDQLDEQMSVIQREQLIVQWRDFVFRRLDENKSPTARRKQHLLIDLSQIPEWTQIGDLLELTPRLALDYADKTGKTVQRDINELIREGLIVRNKDNMREVRANLEIMFAFLPRKINSS